MVDIITVSFALVSLFSIIQLTNSQMSIATVKNGTFEPEGIKLQWCGKERAPQRIDNNTYGITEEQRNISVRFVNGSITCPSEVTTSNEMTKAKFDQELSITGYFRDGSTYYPPEKYCIASWTESNVTVQVCGAAPECGVSNPCIPKCCTINKLFTVNYGARGTCQEPFENSNPFNPILYTTVSKKSSKNSVYYIRSSITKRCGRNKTTVIHEGNQLNDVYSTVLRRCFRILEDGTLRMLDNNMKWVKIAREDYCLDGFQINGSSGKLSVENFMGDEQHYGAFICMNATQQARDSSSRTQTDISFHIVYGVAFSVTAVFLLLTLGVYVLLWKEQKIQGWTTMSHSGTMFLFYIFLAIVHFLGTQYMSVGRSRVSFLCMASGIFLHFFFLSNFCWLTVICFSLYRTFRSINACNHNAKNIGQFMAYAAFAWGLPLVYVVVSVALDQKYRYEPCNEVVVPMYGRETCGIWSAAQGPYLYYPIVALLVVNMTFFTITAYKLYQYKISTAMARENLDKSKEARELFQLFAKLFFVMGFTWILEFVSWSVSGSTKTWYWAIVDIFNILQGIAIFVIYICKANIITSLRKSYPGLRPLLSITDKFGGKSVDIREAETSGTNMMSTASVGDDGMRKVELKSLSQKR
ncbi:unnamed protein product [Allacma fusca]|uniref:G-protein coupled receptors family 2 profile 2 domain-containing protein n=1 Tax=Allacma fusca TaxID=39272 RepID=A0A8J2NRA1_9HEXA|nr:unnamed protein product [Allacma fusca]